MADPGVILNFEEAVIWKVNQIRAWLEEVTKDPNLKPLWGAFFGPFFRDGSDPTAKKSLRVINQLGTDGKLILSLDPLEFTLHGVTWALHTFWDALMTTLNFSLRYESKVNRKPKDYAVCILTLTLKWSNELKECLNVPKNIPPIFSIFWVEVRGSWIFLLCPGKAVEYDPDSDELHYLTNLLVRARRELLYRDLRFHQNDNPFSPQVLHAHKAPIDLTALDNRIMEYSCDNQRIPDTRSTFGRFSNKMLKGRNVQPTKYEIGSCAETWGFQLMKKYPGCRFHTFSLSNDKHKKIIIGPEYTYKHSGTADYNMRTKRMCTNCSYVSSALEAKFPSTTLIEYHNIELPGNSLPPPIPTAQEVGTEDQEAPQPPSDVNSSERSVRSPPARGA